MTLVSGRRYRQRGVKNIVAQQNPTGNQVAVGGKSASKPVGYFHFLDPETGLQAL